MCDMLLVSVVAAISVFMHLVTSGNIFFRAFFSPLILCPSRLVWNYVVIDKLLLYCMRHVFMGSWSDPGLARHTRLKGITKRQYPKS